ncbi:hypothetical protein CRENBAI_013537 [Crenichthys baileyi]|uniref:Uncharacterized protein n=1 Tax=Crenichthys baileyi TaxID=28760 RepID=A0AAV9RM17_9TELE
MRLPSFCKLLDPPSPPHLMACEQPAQRPRHHPSTSTPEPVFGVFQFLRPGWHSSMPSPQPYCPPPSSVPPVSSSSCLGDTIVEMLWSSFLKFWLAPPTFLQRVTPKSSFQLRRIGVSPFLTSWRIRHLRTHFQQSAVDSAPHLCSPLVVRQPRIPSNAPPVLQCSLVVTRGNPLCSLKLLSTLLPISRGPQPSQIHVSRELQPSQIHVSRALRSSHIYVSRALQRVSLTSQLQLLLPLGVSQTSQLQLLLTTIEGTVGRGRLRPLKVSSTIQLLVPLRVNSTLQLLFPQRASHQLPCSLLQASHHLHGSVVANLLIRSFEGSLRSPTSFLPESNTPEDSRGLVDSSKDRAQWQSSSGRLTDPFRDWISARPLGSDG